MGPGRKPRRPVSHNEAQILDGAFENMVLFRPQYFDYLPLRERLHTHKVFTNDQCFYLNYHKFSIKSYVVDVH